MLAASGEAPPSGSCEGHSAGRVCFWPTRNPRGNSSTLKTKLSEAKPNPDVYRLGLVRPRSNRHSEEKKHVSRKRPRSKLGNWNQKCKCREHASPGNICEDSGPDAPGFLRGHLRLGVRQGVTRGERSERQQAGKDDRACARSPRRGRLGGACGP